MGHVWAKVRISSEDGSRLVEVEALVDTGATLTVVPRRLANELGLRVTGKANVMTGSGIATLDRGRAFIEIMGKSDVVPMLISDTADKVLIGVTTLEILGLQVDPVTGESKEWTALLY